MVLSYDEEINLQQKKFEVKEALLIKQNECNMKELEVQLKIEAIKAYNNNLDSDVKKSMTEIIFKFDEQGKEK